MQALDHVVRGRRQLPPVAAVSTTDSVTSTTDTRNCEEFMKFHEICRKYQEEAFGLQKICGPTDGRSQNKKGKAA